MDQSIVIRRDLAGVPIKALIWRITGSHTHRPLLLWEQLTLW